MTSLLGSKSKISAKLRKQIQTHSNFAPFLSCCVASQLLLRRRLALLALVDVLAKRGADFVLDLLVVVLGKRAQKILFVVLHDRLALCK